MSSVLCVGQVVKTPTIILNSPVHKIKSALLVSNTVYAFIILLF